MGWADDHIRFLEQGATVTFRPSGGSMRGKIESGQLVTVEPIRSDTSINVGDIVLCTVHGNQYLHLVKRISGDGERYTIGNNKGGINGMITLDDIHGKCVRVES
jgi:SOS-response transcriptional repressor LexA